MIMGTTRLEASEANNKMKEMTRTGSSGFARRMKLMKLGGAESNCFSVFPFSFVFSLPVSFPSLLVVEVVSFSAASTFCLSETVILLEETIGVFFILRRFDSPRLA